MLLTEKEISKKLKKTIIPFLPTKTVDIGGHKIRYADVGHGANTVLLLHGFPETLQGWRKIAPLLGEHFRVIAPDLLGAGFSDKPDIDYTPERMATFLNDFLKSLNVEKVHLIGTDTGVVLAVAFASMYPDNTDRIILAAGSVYAKDATSWELSLMRIPLLGEMALYNPFVGSILNKSLRKGFYDPRLVSEEMYKEYVDSIRLKGGRRAALNMIRNFSSVNEFMKESIKKIQVPILVVYADNDRYFPVESGKRLSSYFKNSQLQIISDCGHFLQEEKPEELNKLIVDFLLNDNL